MAALQDVRMKNDYVFARIVVGDVDEQQAKIK
jgi:hypothetical protein